MADKKKSRQRPGKRRKAFNAGIAGVFLAVLPIFWFWLIAP